MTPPGTATLAGEENESAKRPEILAMVKERFAAWQEEMKAAEPRGPFRDY